MRARRLSELVELMQPTPVELYGEDAVVGPDVVLDNRHATPGSLFVAIPGERVDGHDFAPEAVSAGAAAVLGTHLTRAEVPHLLVEESVAGLSGLARGIVREARERGMLSLGITGSSGKTSTKDLLAQVLEAEGETVAPVGSQNNEIGVPLTACRVGDATRFLVSEMGARGVGHIEWLTSLVGLDVGVVLNVGAAHVGEFGGVDQTARAKAEIISGLAADGWAVLNADNPACRDMASLTSARLAWFGEGGLPDGQMQVLARDVVCNESSQAGFTLVARRGEVVEQATVQLQVIGRHQVSNALAAAAAALAVGMDITTVAERLSMAQPRSSWRMELLRLSEDRLVLNDAYNANPESMAAALRTASELAEVQRQRHPGARLIAVLGDMLELGPMTTAHHTATGQLAADLEVDELLAVGQHAPIVVAAAVEAGASARVATRDEAARLRLGPGDVLLVKGSRGIGLEKVASAVVESTGEVQA
ncbi:MAG: UDP-N-acetylmuramoyl-tripeptide--D-alanyl-D-alanine ligase [Propionibacteriaceae bacterium]|nr:UDP-N-acetylmuramoyl-tripeptide--D-alanyl-D-alanine ligase [Propionibacteriaceae bacterium]